MKKQILTVLLALLLLLPFHIACAAQNQALEGLEILRRGFVGVGDFSAEIVQQKELSLMRQKLVSRGVVRFKKPGLFYMELFPPYASRLLLQDNLLSYVLTGEGVREKVVLPPEESLGRWFAYLERPITALPEGVELSAERQGESWTLHIVPRGKGGVRAFHISFLADGRLQRLIIEERNGDRTTLKFSRLRKNVGLTARDFTLD